LGQTVNSLKQVRKINRSKLAKLVSKKTTWKSGEQKQSAKSTAVFVFAAIR
jgi:hypothetical protein